MATKPSPAVPATPSQLAANDLAAQFRARNPVIWVKTSEEARVKRFVFEAAAASGYTVHMWDCGQGVTTISGRAEPDIAGEGSPEVVFDKIKDRKGERAVWVMCDLPPWLKDPITTRKLVNLALDLPSRDPDNAQALVILSPSADIPAELANNVSSVDWPLPNRAEIGELLDAAIDSVKDKLPDVAPNGVRDAAIDAAVGLTGAGAQACFARSLVQLRKIDPTIIASEKKRAIARDRVLEWYDPLPGGLDAVGGLDELKKWLVSRACAFSSKARAYGLPTPNGVLLLGISGCGKSLTAKAVATAWSRPLLRLDLGALKSKYVGESEANLRKALAQAETIGGIIWLDEIEKALEGATSGASDGGVSADALGAILSWMQERKGDAFVIATANNVDKLPPEFLRKGRFDEVWWVDLPTRAERVEIMAAALREYKRDAFEIGIDLLTLADATNNFTGAEIASLVPDALFTAFADDAREITTADLVSAAKKIVPLAVTAEEKIRAQREMWSTRTRKATSEERPDTAARSSDRKLDL